MEINNLNSEIWLKALIRTNNIDDKLKIITDKIYKYETKLDNLKMLVDEKRIPAIDRWAIQNDLFSLFTFVHC